jgi:outer membrane receptor protein involved in Fe transport
LGASFKPTSLLKIKYEKMIKNTTFLTLLFLLLGGVAFSQTSIQGKITEEETGEAVLFATIALYKNDVLMSGTESDFDGNYSFSDIDPGTYSIEVSFLGLATQRIQGIVAKAGKVNIVSVSMKEEGQLLDVVDIVDYKVPLVEFDNTTQGKALTAESIQNLPTKNIGAIAATSAGVSLGRDGQISVRGSRTNSTYYYIDGVRVTAANAQNLVPQAQIEQMQIITGGIAAKYGDVTGGIISITTRGPSNKFTAALEAETSEYLDAFGYNLINASMSGPLIRNKEGESVLGFRAFGQYRNIRDDGPSAIGVYRASESLIQSLEAEPVRSLNGTLLPATEFVTNDVPEGSDERVNLLDARPNETDRDYNVGVNLDARLSNNIDISLSGTYYNSKNRFTPSRAWGLYNWPNNPYGYSDGLRSSVRIRHRLGNQNFGSGEDRKESIIRNASYSIQIGYEKSNSRNEDLRHEQNLFRYGHWGTQEREWIPAIDLIDTSNWGGQFVQVADNIFFAHAGWQQVDGEFTPGPHNPVLARINNVNGFFEPAVNGGWELYNNVGQVYNTVSKSERETYTVNVDSGFDFVPGGSDRGKHSIQFGFMYEQRISRAWRMSPRQLWILMRQQVNRHIEQGLDANNPIDVTFDRTLGSDFTVYAPLNNEDEFAENLFYRKVRELTGQGITEFVNVDGLNPDDLSLDMFSATELNNFRNIGLNYYGYDYLGNRTSNNIAFNDIFTERDENGRRTMNVAPFSPIYGAGYIQDKFTYKDIIFRLGLRVDYYDANTKVLRDPYTLNAIKTADQFFSENPDLTRPGTVGDDYKVYVAGENSNSVVGYRVGDQWFRPDGTATDGNLLFGGGLVFPAYEVEDPDARDLKNENYDPDGSFKDYDPQLNFMPRLAFSFPISESAGFFAHYDVLVERPTSNTLATSLNYYYFVESFTGGFNNPDLRPQRTIDYEVGFQQKISNSSALKVSAYYKEVRDMIQQRFLSFVPAPISRYQTYGNIDFGTVKGFSFNYDLRRTGNFELNATYTLQFADGSGSDANSSAGLNQRGDIRNLNPLSFDERHRITAVADYRYGSGKNYNGPRIGNKDIFANAGINLIITAVSGRPYSTFRTVTAPLGASQRETINGARLPWQFNADLQVDKNFMVKFSEESQRSLAINVYLRVQNLFDIRNVVGVYSASDDPENEGYLTNQFGEARINQIINDGFVLDSFLAHYQWRTAQPGFFTLPRQIFLGTIINF